QRIGGVLIMRNTHVLSSSEHSSSEPSSQIPFAKRIAASAVLASTIATGAAAAESPSSGTTLLEEIVVTAQRREESLSRTPVAITAVSSEDLAKNQVRTEQDLRFVAPGLVVRTTINSNQLGFAI